MVPAGALIAVLLAAEPQPRWYGWETLLADGAALTLGAVAYSHRNDLHAGRLGSTAMVLGTAAGATYLASAPLIHVFNGNAHAVGRSLTLRIFVPAVAALTAFLVLQPLIGSGCNSCAYVIVPISAAGLLAPIAIDAGRNAWQPVPRVALLPAGRGLVLAWNF